jgi:Flp pilus assembly pilin Flp
MFNIMTDDTGAAGVEYAILISGIAVGIVAGAFILGSYAVGSFDSVTDALAATDAAAAPD